MDEKKFSTILGKGPPLWSKWTKNFFSLNYDNLYTKRKLSSSWYEICCFKKNLRWFKSILWRKAKKSTKKSTKSTKKSTKSTPSTSSTHKNLYSQKKKNVLFCTRKSTIWSPWLRLNYRKSDMILIIKILEYTGKNCKAKNQMDT